MRWRWLIPWRASGWELVTRNTRHHERVGTLGSTPWPPERGVVLEMRSVTSGQWCNQSCVMEPLQKSLFFVVWRASMLVNRCRWQEGGVPAEGVEALNHSLFLALCISPIWLCWSCVCYNKPIVVSEMLFWVPWVSLIQEAPEFVAIQSEVPVTTLDFWMASEVGTVLWDLTLILGRWCQHWIESYIAQQPVLGCWGSGVWKPQRTWFQKYCK